MQNIPIKNFLNSKCLKFLKTDSNYEKEFNLLKQKSLEYKLTFDIANKPENFFKNR